MMLLKIYGSYPDLVKLVNKLRLEYDVEYLDGSYPVKNPDQMQHMSTLTSEEIISIPFWNKLALRPKATTKPRDVISEAIAAFKNDKTEETFMDLYRTVKSEHRFGHLHKKEYQALREAYGLYFWDSDEGE